MAALGKRSQRGPIFRKAQSAVNQSEAVEHLALLERMDERCWYLSERKVAG